MCHEQIDESALACVVSVSARYENESVVLVACIDKPHTMKDSVTPSMFLLEPIGGAFEFEVPTWCYYPASTSYVNLEGEKLQKSNVRGRLGPFINVSSVWVRLEAQHVIKYLGVEASGAAASFVLSRRHDASWTNVLNRLDPTRAVELVVKIPALARHLSQDAAKLYSETNRELAETWELI